MRQEEYQNYTDEELIRLIHQGEDGPVDYLMEKYKNMVRGKAKTLYLIGGDHEDLIQEGMIGLFRSIRDFDESRESGFAAFAALCVSRQLYKAIEAQNRKKNQNRLKTKKMIFLQHYSVMIQIVKHKVLQKMRNLISSNSLKNRK